MTEPADRIGVRRHPGRYAAVGNIGTMPSRVVIDGRPVDALCICRLVPVGDFREIFSTERRTS